MDYSNLKFFEDHIKAATSVFESIAQKGSLNPNDKRKFEMINGRKVAVAFVDTTAFSSGKPEDFGKRIQELNSLVKEIFEKEYSNDELEELTTDHYSEMIEKFYDAQQNAEKVIGLSYKEYSTSTQYIINDLFHNLFNVFHRKEIKTEKKPLSSIDLSEIAQLMEGFGLNITRESFDALNAMFKNENLKKSTIELKKNPTKENLEKFRIEFAMAKQTSNLSSEEGNSVNYILEFFKIVKSQSKDNDLESKEKFKPLNKIDEEFKFKESISNGDSIEEELKEWVFSEESNISIYLDAAIRVFKSVIDNNGITPNDPRVYHQYGEERLCVGFRKKKVWEIPKGTFTQRINEITSTILIKLSNAFDEEIKQSLDKRRVSCFERVFTDSKIHFEKLSEDSKDDSLKISIDSILGMAEITIKKLENSFNVEEKLGQN